LRHEHAAAAILRTGEQVMKFEQMGAIAGRATTKEPHELTHEERLALAFMAGCEIETSWEQERYVMRAKYPIGIDKVNGKLRVSEYRGAQRTGAEP
jgi:hypothetical protein